MCSSSFVPFNEAPAHLKGAVRDGSDGDSIVISGYSDFQVVDWYKLGCRTRALHEHSFAFSVDAVPHAAVGAYSIGIHGDCAINASHFLCNAAQLQSPCLVENAYSAWAYDNSGSRTQRGGVAPWESIGRSHNLMVLYDSVHRRLVSLVNGLPLHSVHGDLGEFTLAIRFEAVGIQGNFNVAVRNMYYYCLDSDWGENITRLAAWDPQYAPSFISYAHADKDAVAPFAAALRRAGVRVLGDWDLRPGDSLLETISKYISRAGYLLVMLSRRSVVSPWVESELRMAMTAELSARRVIVVPVLVEDCDIPLFLRDKLYVDLRASDAETTILDMLRRHGSW